MFEDLTNWILELFKKNSGGGGAVVNAYRIRKKRFDVDRRLPDEFAANALHIAPLTIFPFYFHK